MNLLAFPCDREVAENFCKRVAPKRAAALILQKQERGLKDVLSTHKIDPVFRLQEEHYGRVTLQETREILTGLFAQAFDRALFPLNDFCANTALLLSILVPEVLAVNANSEVPVELKPEDRPVNLGPEEPFDAEAALQVQWEILERLKKVAPQLSELSTGEEAGERPTDGLLRHMPYDSEVLARYAYASGKVKGQVLEIGCGIGYGAFAMVRLKSGFQVTALDHDGRAIDLARFLWADDRRLRVDLAQAESLPYGDESFDAVVCFEVIEHVRHPERLLAEIRRVLCKGGRLIGSTPNFRLYPFRVNRAGLGDPHALRRAGIWPWHVQAFDENGIRTLLRQHGFVETFIQYPTFLKGVSLWKEMRSAPFPQALDLLSTLDWWVSDFGVLDQFHPCFSGHSFLFTGWKAL